MFRTEEIRAEICHTLMQQLPGTAALWTEDGPTDEACALRDANGGPLSGGERALLLVTFALWDQSGPFADLHRLDGDRFRLLGSLLVALAQDSSLPPQDRPRVSAVDVWLDAWRRPAGRPPLLRVVDSSDPTATD